MKNSTFNFPSCNEGYTMVSGKLTKVAIERIVFDLNIGKSWCLITVNGQVCQRAYDELFQSEEAFRNNDQLKASRVITTTELLTRLNLQYEIREGGEIFPIAWQFYNGKPQKVSANVGLVTTKNGFPVPGATTITVNGKPDEPFYGSYEDCLSWNDYVVIDEKGERTIKSAKKRMVLNDTQSKIMDEIEAQFKKALDNGIRFVWDSEDEKLIAINTSAFSEIQTVYGGDADGTFDVEVGANEFGAFRNIEPHQYWLNCEYCAYIKFKNDGAQTERPQ